MKVYIYTILANIFIAVWILISVFLVRYTEKYFLKRFDYIVAFVWWVLSGIVFLWILPKILLFAKVWNFNLKFISLSILLGIFIFFVIELLFHFHHCKDLWKQDCIHNYISGKLMMIWTFIHNFLHWIIIYTGFLTNFTFWILLTISIFFHSIPQNISNYLMNHKNLKWVLVAGLGWVLGAIVLYPFKEYILHFKVYFLACVVGMLLYLIISDILPEFKKRLYLKTQLLYLFFWMLWIVFYVLLEFLSKTFFVKHI